MVKKLSFNDLPSAVEKILEILSSEETGQTAIPDIIQRINLLEKKIDYLQKTVSPELAVMDTQTVCRVLKLRPKTVKELADSGILPYRTEGRKVRFYEEGVVKYFMTQPSWRSATSKPEKPKAEPKRDQKQMESVPAEIETGERQRIDISVAEVILDRSAAAIYQLASNNRVPHHRNGRAMYFFKDELLEWAKDNPPRKRKQK